MLSNLFLILDERATSFCYYSNPGFGEADAEFMPLKLLRRALAFAEENGLGVTCLLGSQSLPEKHQQLLDSTVHGTIVPLSLLAHYPDAVPVINPGDLQSAASLEMSETRNLILRLEKDSLGSFDEVIGSLLGRFKRLNVSLLDIPEYGDEDLQEYQNQLEAIVSRISAEFIRGHAIELNFLTDRLLLTEMNNCQAGVDHLTLGPNGKLYICPALYHDDPDQSVGELEAGVQIKNSRLLELDNAPICKLCDAYHCKRCVFLNKKTTLEVNTPSHQQCALSHLEREGSRRILSALGHLEDFESLDPIPELDYLDPLVLLTDPNRQKKREASVGLRKKAKSAEKPVRDRPEYKGPVVVWDGDRRVELPRLAAVVPPEWNRKKEQKAQDGEVKALLREILKTQRAILAVLKEHQN